MAELLSDRLMEEGNRFNFFQAVRLLERLAKEQAISAGGRPPQPVGGDDISRPEAVMFHVKPSVCFAPGAVNRIDPPEAPKPPDSSAFAEASNPGLVADRARAYEMLVEFMGLIGAGGILPSHYTLAVMERLIEKDRAIRDFFDLFHHRTIALFYRAWQKYRFAITYERRDLHANSGEEDVFRQMLFSFVGMGSKGHLGRLEIDDETFLYYSGHFSHYPRSATNLEGILDDYFDFPIRVEQFVGQWLYLNDNERTEVPSKRSPEGVNSILGESFVIGARVWDVQGKFRLRIGPIKYDRFLSLMPTGDGLLPLSQLTRMFVGPQYDFDVQPVLEPDEVPWFHLRTPRTPTDRHAIRLGWNTWIRRDEFKREVDDALFSLANV